MNEEYLRGLHGHLGIKDDYDTWINAVKDNEEYLKGLHGHLGIKDDYDTWHTAVLGKKKDSTESVSTGEAAPTPQASDSEQTAEQAPVPVPATLKKSMEQFAKTGKVAEEQPLAAEEAAEPKEKAGGSSILIDQIFTEESAKYREAQDALMEYDKLFQPKESKGFGFGGTGKTVKFTDAEEMSQEDLEYTQKNAIRKAGEVLGMDFTGKSYEEVQNIVNGGKGFAEQILAENTLEKAKEEELKDPTKFGLTRTAFWDSFIDKPARELGIRAAVARGDYETAERLQQDINERVSRTQLSLGIDPTDERGITETWQEGDTEKAIYKGFFGAANSTGGLLLTMADPTVGLSYFGTTSYLSTYNSYVDRGDLTWEQKESLALIAGATEVAVGKFMGGLNNVKRFRNAVGISDDIGRATMAEQRAAYNKVMDFLEPYSNKFVDIMKKPAVRGVTRTAYDTASEAVEEGVVELINQTAAHIIANDEYDAYAIYDSMILGAAMGGPMGTVTGFQNYRAINSIYKRPLSEDVENYESLQAQYKDLKQAMKEESDPAKKEVIREVLGEVRQEIKDITKKADAAYNKLSDKEAVELYNAHKEIEKLSREAKEASNPAVKKALGNKIAGLLVRKGEIEAKAGIKAEVDTTVEPTGATEITAQEPTTEAPAFQEIKAAQDKARQEAAERISPDATPKDMLNKRGRYFNPADNSLVEGVVAQDGQTLVIETDEGNIIEIGNIDEVGDTPLREVGLTDARAVISINEDGSFTYNSVAGAAPQGTNMVPSAPNLKSIRRDKQGNIKRVVMKSPDGKQTYNLTGQDAQDVAYQLYLRQMQTPEGAAKVESELQKDEEARAIIEGAERATKPTEKAAEPTKGEAARGVDEGAGKPDGTRVEAEGIESVGVELTSKAKSALGKVRKALQLVAPDVKIVVHSSRDSYDKTYDGAEKSKGHFNPNTNTIHILVLDGKLMGEGTQTLLRHEAIHPILDAILQYSPQATARAAASVRRILSRLGDSQKAEGVRRHAAKYSKQGQEVEDLELVTEFLAVYSDADAIEDARKAMPTFLERVGDVLTRLLRSFNLIDGKTKLESDKEIMSLLSNLEFAFSTGKAVRPRRHKNIVDSKTKQIRESIDREGKEPYAPKKGADFDSVHDGWVKSGSNYVIATDLEHSFELRRMGFYESHQKKDGRIILAKGVQYKSYDAANNVARIHPKSFISKNSIKEARKQKIAETLSAFAKFINADVKYIDDESLGFTSTLIIPDSENGLKEPTPVVNLAYANARTGAAGFSTFIVEAVRTASPITINEVLMRMKEKTPEIYGIYERYKNQNDKLDITKDLSEEDKEFIAFSRLLQESIDRVLTGAISGDYADFAIDMQKAFSEVITEKGTQPSAKNAKGEYYVELMPFGEDFVPSLKSMFIDKKIEFQESLQRGKDLANTLIDNLANIFNKASSSEVNARKNALKSMIANESNRLNVIDWIAIYTESDFQHPAIKMILEGEGLPSIHENFEYVAEDLGKFYVSLSDVVSDKQSYRKVEKAFFGESVGKLNESEQVILDFLKKYENTMTEYMKASSFDSDNKVFKPLMVNFISDVAAGKNFDYISEALGIEEGIIRTARLNEGSMELVRETAFDALGGSREGLTANLAKFIEDNVFEKALDVLPMLDGMVKITDTEAAAKVKAMNNPVEAFRYATNKLGFIAIQDAFNTVIDYKDLKKIINRIHKKELPDGFDIVFNESTKLEISVSPDANGVIEVSYGFEYDANSNTVEYADYPSTWKIGSITMPLVFKAVAEMGGLINAKAIEFSAIANAPSDNIPISLYSDKERDSFAQNKSLRNKRRGINNKIAFRNGKIVNARKSGEVSFFFEGKGGDNIVYTTSDERIINLAGRLSSEEGRLLGEQLGELIYNNREVYNAVKSGEIKTTTETFPKDGPYMAQVYKKSEEVNSISYVFKDAESIKNTGVLASTFENSVKYIHPAAIRESLADGQEAFEAIDNMTAEAEKQIIELSKSKKWNWKYLTSRKAWVDRNANLRKAMSAGFSRYVNALVTNRAGATSYADRKFQTIRKGIYDKITNTERQLLDEYIFMRRVIDIDTTWMERKAVYSARVQEEQNQIRYYEMELAEAKKAGDKALIKEIQDDIKDSKSKLKYFESQVEKYAETPKHPTYGDKEINKRAAEDAIEFMKNKFPQIMPMIEERAEKYFDAYTQILQEQYEAGLIDKETRDRFIDNDYSPRQFLSKMFGEVDQIVFQRGGLSDSQIKSIRDGSDENIFTDTEYMLDLSYRALENKKAKNRLYKEMHKEAKRKGFDNISDGQFIREGNFKKNKDGSPKMDGFGNMIYEAADKNFTNIYYRDGGKLRAFQIRSDYASELAGVKGYMLPPKLRRAIKWVTGTQIVKATSTALNPFFAITGTIRGFREVTRGRGVYDKYRFLPLMNAMVFIDFVKASKEAVLDTALVEEYYAHGGGLSFMTTQGKPDKLYQKKNRFSLEFLQRRGIELNPFKPLAYAGEKAELALRLAIYQRTKQQLQESMPEATEEQIKFMAAEEARLIADFAQGGELSAELDLFSPYFNASIQGTRASYDYARKNPKKFFEKQVQAYMLNTALAIWARMMLWDDEEKKDWYSNISPWIVERYNIIPTGLKNSLGEPVTIRIPKVHQFLMFDSLSEITAKNIAYFMKGEEAPKDDLNPDGDAWFFLESVMSSFPAGQFVPISEIRQGRNVLVGIAQRMIGTVPLASASISYFGNYDTFRDKIVSYTKGEEMPFAEGYKDGNVHDIYKFFGDITEGLGRGSISPKRMETAVEKIIGSESTLLTGLLYELTDKFITVKEEKELVQPEEANKEFRNMYGFGKSFIYTIPKEAYKEKSDIEDLVNMKAVTDHNKIKKNVRIVASKYTLDELVKMGDSGKFPEELTTYIDSIDEPDIIKKYYFTYFKNVAKGNAVNDDKYFNIKYARTPKAELELFFHYFGDPAELTDSEKLEIQQNLQLIGYTFSDQVKAYYPRMKK